MLWPVLFQLFLAGLYLGGEWLLGQLTERQRVPPTIVQAPSAKGPSVALVDGSNRVQSTASVASTTEITKCVVKHRQGRIFRKRAINHAPSFASDEV